MRCGIRIPAWYLLLVAILGILSSCQSLRELEGFAIRHNTALTSAQGIELTSPPSDSAFRYFFQQVDVAALCAAIRDWTIAQIPCGASNLDQLVCDGKIMRGSIEPISSGGSAFIALVTLYASEFWEHRNLRQVQWVEAEGPPGHRSVSRKRVTPRPAAMCHRQRSGRH